MEQIELIIDGQHITATSNMTILAAAKQAGIPIPTLCNRDDLPTKGNCRLCLVEVNGYPRLLTACSTPISQGMQVRTDSERVLKARRTIVELLLSNHNRECTSCEKNKACELQEIADKLGIQDEKFDLVYQEQPRKEYNSLIVREPDKCIKCGRCLDVCSQMQHKNALAMLGRGYRAQISFGPDDAIDSSGCNGCGKCLAACPTGAMYVNKQLFALWDAIDDPDKYVVLYLHPEQKVELGKTAGYQDIIQLEIEQLVGFFKDIGIDAVVDAGTVYAWAESEYASEWRSYSESPLPISDDLSATRVRELHSLLTGAHIKSFNAKKLGLKPTDIITVAVTDILSLKLETANAPTERNIDIVLSMEEIPLLISQTMLNISDIRPRKFDKLMI